MAGLGQPWPFQPPPAGSGGRRGPQAGRETGVTAVHPRGAAWREVAPPSSCLSRLHVAAHGLQLRGPTGPRPVTKPAPGTVSSGDGGTRVPDDPACCTGVPPRHLRLWAAFHDMINFHFKAPVSQDLPLLTAKCVSATELGGDERRPTPPSAAAVPWACPSLGAPGSQAVSGTKKVTVCIQDASAALGGARPKAGCCPLSPPELSLALGASGAPGGRGYSICIVKPPDGSRQGPVSRGGKLGFLSVMPPARAGPRAGECGVRPREQDPRKGPPMPGGDPCGPEPHPPWGEASAMTATSPGDTQAVVGETGTPPSEDPSPFPPPAAVLGLRLSPRPASRSFPRGDIVVFSGLLGADSLSGGPSRVGRQPGRVAGAGVPTPPTRTF